MAVADVACIVAVPLVVDPARAGRATAAQLGGPVTATTLGAQAHLLRPGDAPALILRALVTVAGTALAATALARGDHPRWPADDALLNRPARRR